MDVKYEDLYDCAVHIYISVQSYVAWTYWYIVQNPHIKLWILFLFYYTNFRTNFRTKTL